MEVIKKYFWQILVVILVFSLFLQQSCSGDKITKNDSIIITKPKVGGFDYYKPKPIKGLGYTLITKEGDTIEIENPVNKELEQKYLNALSENEKLKLYLEAIQKRTYTDTLEDKNIKIDYIAETTGTLNDIKINYTIKPDTIKIKKPVFTLYGGLGSSMSVDIKPGIKLNLGYQNKKGNLIFAGYDPINRTITADYNIKIFDIKR